MARQQFNVTLSVQGVERLVERIESTSTEYVGMTTSAVMTQGQQNYRRALIDPRYLAQRYEEGVFGGDVWMPGRKAVNRAVRFTRMGLEMIPTFGDEFLGGGFTSAALMTSHMGHLLQQGAVPGLVTMFTLWLTRIYRELADLWEAGQKRLEKQLQERLETTTKHVLEEVDRRVEESLGPLEQKLKDELKPINKGLDWIFELDRDLTR